ncbi:hypothetical protein KSD_49730 [Ktedonobacter sp. SOSP1-85]|uniref:hypothetical protein n=1 Tax=Ktedonobacter sp. SOSP1-85 TaxID=2778367 RepID=UPI001914EC19|nr:hypothetical protein [Ktedonobacter sp. SOSP1-85]GHO77202.1 hypothetical protein KSD_49730 [Ktedonobacter sp. SOSP1-85]
MNPVTIVAPSGKEYHSSDVATIRAQRHSSLGMQFIGITPLANGAVSDKNSTSSNEETSNDGSSKLDPVYDDD